MAIVSIDGGLWLGPIPQWFAAVPGFTTTTALTASTHKTAMIFQVPHTGTLDKIEFRMGAIANSPDNGIRVSFQDVDATTGAPDGTQDQYRDIAAGSLTASTWTVPGLMTSDGTDGGTKRSVTKGQWMAAVIEYVSFVASDSFSISVTNLVSATNSPDLNFTYAAHYNGASWSKSVNTWNMALKYDDGTYRHIANSIIPMTAANSNTFNSGSTPDERGLRFQVPWDCEIDGIQVRVDVDNVADLILYDSGSSALVTVSLDPDIRATSNAMNGMVTIPTTALTANTTYRIAVKPTSASSVIVHDIDVNSAAIMQSFAGGTAWYSTTRTDAGAWTDTTTNRPMIGLRISGIDTGGGASSSGGAFTFLG